MTVRFAILFLLIGTSMGWSQRMHKPKEPLVAEESKVNAESKLSPRYHHGHRSRSGYILEEDDQPEHLAGPHGHDYVDSEEHSSQKEQNEAVGNEEHDKAVKDDEYDDHLEKGGHQRFEAGGASFDKHLKDHKADNKEVENVKEHDIGEKFGAEARKEHKKGKNKEKSKGHKLHGFKNVYHKEEYGDHKTFHDEFLDSDVQNKYDDHHEHQEMHGGKFSKGFKHEGKNDKYDKGDEKREWGKAEYDTHNEGKHEKGGQLSKHRHGSKKHQGQYDASYHKNKNAVHKTKKGNLPPYAQHAGHHGPHQAQIQPYVSHHASHHEHAPSHSHHSRPHSYGESQHAHYDEERDHSHSGHNYHHPQSQHDDSHAHNHGGHNIQSHGGSHSQDEVDNDDYHQERTVQNHRQKSLAKDHVDDKIDGKFSHKLELPEPKLPASSHFGSQEYRQPLFQEDSLFKEPEAEKQEKFSDPFDERSHNADHNIKYGYQPRNHHHSHHHQQKQQEKQPFLRFPEFHHQHRAHDHTHHAHNGAHSHHIRPLANHHQQVPATDVSSHRRAHSQYIRPLASHHHQVPTTDASSHKSDHASAKLRDEAHRRFSQKRYE